MTAWLVRPWYDEGEDWPCEPGTTVRVEAEDGEQARKAYLASDDATGALVAWLELTEVYE